MGLSFCINKLLLGRKMGGAKIFLTHPQQVGISYINTLLTNSYMIEYEVNSSLSVNHVGPK